MTTRAATPPEPLTLHALQQQSHLGSGELQEGEHYVLERASFGESEDCVGGKDRAHLVLRCPQSGKMFAIIPILTAGPGADGKTYPWKGLTCVPISRE